jgi:N-acetylmuramoyl-L-alanine amidase
MEVSEDFRLELKERDAINYRFEASRNFKAGLTPQQILIYAPERRDVQSQVLEIKTGAISAHLIIGKDGSEIVQMGEFDRSAIHHPGFNKTSLAIRLDYPGSLIDHPNHFKSIHKFEPSRILFATPVRGTKTRPWPLFPKAQLDTLLAVLRALLDKFESIHSIFANDEVSPGRVDPGPAFPRTLFREKLLLGRGVLDTIEETNQEIPLLAGPNEGSRMLYENTIPKGTPVSIMIENGDWVLVEALTEIHENPWMVGWAEKRFVTPRVYIPVVRDHMLHTEDGRHYVFIPAHETNFESKSRMETPKYIVMHFTTGTQMSSTINHFLNPGTAATHLLIGRDGRVIQFVPFNKIAHHVGIGFWEGERNLNRMTIGIELDNAGSLKNNEGQWFRKKTIIQPDFVKEAVHWKETNKRGWETFSPIQLQVALDVVNALVKHYNIQDILGHDMINLINRTDPGPLFPIEDWREKIYGRKEPVYKAHVIADKAGATAIYANPDGNPPVFPEPGDSAPAPVELRGSPLSNGTRVRIQQIGKRWTLVFVFPDPAKNLRWMEGWVKNGSIQPVGEIVA